MKRHTLQAESRTILGSKVKKLRESGMIPATVYGKGLESVSVTVREADFSNIYKETGETGLIDLTVGSEIRPVLVHAVQQNPLDGSVQNIEFHQVNLKEKVHANIPVTVTGEAIAVKENLGVLLTLINEIEVEALPANLPERIEVDVSNLSEVDQQITVKELQIPGDVTLLTDPEVIVVKIGALKAPEPEAAPAPAAEGAEAPVAEGEEAPAAPTQEPAEE